ncbi:MAG: tetratricopeptide repeat protein, partial [Chloroflexota bacterium]
VPFANVSRSEQDSLTFVAVENRYMSGDCDKALPGLKSYVEKFPDGNFTLNAHYYKADCESRSGNLSEALKSYEQILARPKNTYTENSALKASQILFNQKDFAKALLMYQKLEENAENKENIAIAITGQMRCNYEVGNYGQTIQYAQRVLEMNQLSAAMKAEANLLMGRCSLALKRPEQARSAFAETVKLSQGAPGAEALYSLALIAFDMKDYTTAENNIFKVSSDYASQQYWLAKAFILLSDVYLIQGNTFQAKQTLQSIIDNYEGEDLKQEATNKLRNIEQGENNRPSGTKVTDDEEGIIIK